MNDQEIISNTHIYSRPPGLTLPTDYNAVQYDEQNSVVNNSFLVSAEQRFENNSGGSKFNLQKYLNDSCLASPEKKLCGNNIPKMNIINEEIDAGDGKTKFMNIMQMFNDPNNIDTDKTRKSDYNPESNRKSDCNPENTNVKKKNFVRRHYKAQIVLSIIVTLFIFSKTAVGKYYTNEQYLKSYNVSSEFAEHHKNQFIVFCFIFHFVYNLTLLPGHIFPFILTAYQLKTFWTPFFVIQLSYLLSATVGYIVIKKCFFKKFVRKYKDDYRYRLIKDMDGFDTRYYQNNGAYVSGGAIQNIYRNFVNTIWFTIIPFYITWTHNA